MAAMANNISLLFLQGYRNLSLIDFLLQAGQTIEFSPAGFILVLFSFNINFIFKNQGNF